MFHKNWWFVILFSTILGLLFLISWFSIPVIATNSGPKQALKPVETAGEKRFGEISGFSSPLAPDFSGVAGYPWHTTEMGNDDLIPVSYRLAPASSPIVYGQIVTGAISTPGQVVTYTFAAVAGDMVLVRMSEGAGNLYPRVRVFGPDGALVCEAAYSSATAEINCALPNAGTYTILAFDYYGTYTGDYALYLQRLNNPGNSTPITFGQTLSGSITMPAEMDTYTFAALAGDTVLVRMSEGAGNFYPRVRVFDPDGALVCEATYNSATAEITGCALTSTGTYTILAFDYYGTYTGDYALYLQRLNNPGNSMPITFGQTLSGSITMPAEMDTYTFAAVAGDTVLVRMSEGAGNLYPNVRVFDPDGALVCEAAYNSATAEITGCALTSTGTYTILAFDYYGTYTGDYALYLQRLNNPGNSMPITFGQTLSGSITMPAEMDTYTFAALAGDTVLVRMSEGPGNLYPSVRVFGPDGALVCEAAYNSATAEINCALPNAGTYTILAFDYYGTYTGDYALYLQRLNNPGNSTPITFGQTLSGSITMPAEMDTYTFAALAGDTVLVRMSEGPGNLYPSVRVFGPDGALVCEATYNSATAEINCALLNAGTYTILAFDYYGTYTGDYALYLRQSNPNILVPLIFETPQEIDVASDLPLWFEIEVLSNTENLFLALQKYSSWSGELKVYSGTQVLTSTAGYSDQILQWPSPTPGKYRVEVSGSGSGRLTAYTRLPELTSGEWKTGVILHSWGSAWYQYAVPAGQSSLFVSVETIGLWSQLKVYRGAFGNTPYWDTSGPTMSLEIPSPEPGIYYVELTDSAWIVGDNQARDHLIRASVTPANVPVCAIPAISNFVPTKGGNTGPVTIEIQGQCFDPQLEVCLTHTGEDDICASPVTVNGDRRNLVATFNLSAITPGEWLIRMTDPDSQTVMAPLPFIVENGGASKLWVEIVGRQTIRAGRQQIFYVRYGNSGNVDAKGIPLWIDGIPEDATWELGAEIQPPPQPDGEDPIDWSQVPVHVESDGQILIPLLIPTIPPGYTGEIPVKITIPSNRQIKLRARINPVGLLCSPDTAGEKCISALINKAIGALPGAGCLTDVGCWFYNYALPGAAPGDIRSMFRDWVGAIFSCAGDLNPFTMVVNAVRDALAMVNTVSDCYDAMTDAVLDVMAVTSISPEDKYGPPGYDAPDTPAGKRQHWIPSDRELDYRIDFWNKADAPAATVDVIITDTLDADLDWSTFKFTEIGFLDWQVPLEPTQYFQVDVENVRIDLSQYYPGAPAVTMTVNIEGSFNPDTGEIRWEFHAREPGTSDPPEEPLAGFLPPITDSGWEVGWVDFSVSPRADLSSGTVISNQSFVKFDLNPFNPAPPGGPYINTLDVAPPVSAVQPPTGIRLCNNFRVSWVGQDDSGGSGLDSFDVYADELEDSAPAYLWQANTTATAAMFAGVPGHKYGFYTRARDNSGNVESSPEPFGYDVEITAGMQCVHLPLILKVALTERNIR